MDNELAIILTPEQALLFYGIESAKPFQINGNLANVGEMIRNAREHRQISIELLSDKLNLDPKIVRQLESNRYDTLPGETFIRGYISLVARELGAESEPLLKVYDIQKKEAEPYLKNNVNDSKEGWSDWVSLLIVPVILALSIGIYYLSYLGKIDESRTVTELRLDNIKKNNQQTPENFSLEPSNDSPISSPGDTKLSGEDDERIIVTARRGTWLEITDDLGTVLYRDLINPNQTLEVLGSPPYDLMIGDGTAVDIEFRGELVKLADFLDQSSVARFKVGNL